MGSSETVHCWGFRGKLGGWDMFGGHFGVSGSESHHFSAADHSTGWGKAWGSIVVVNDVVDLVDA